MYRIHPQAEIPSYHSSYTAQSQRWTTSPPDWASLFFAHLERTGLTSTAAELAGVSRQAIYYHLNRNSEFRKKWEIARSLPSPRHMFILRLLILHGEMYALEMVRHAQDRLHASTIYVTLKEMLQRGYVVSRRVQYRNRGVPRRYYRPTEAGRRALKLALDKDRRPG